MNELTKVSQITVQDCADYMHIAELTDDEINTINNLIIVAKTFIQNYTGHTQEELDNYQDFIIVMFVLVQDMYDNRTMYVDNTNLNVVIDSILGMHSVNLL